MFWYPDNNLASLTEAFQKATFFSTDDLPVTSTNPDFRITKLLGKNGVVNWKDDHSSDHCWKSANEDHRKIFSFGLIIYLFIWNVIFFVL